MQQLHNELIASPDYGGLLGSRHADTNNVMICDTMLCSLAHPQLLPMIYHHKMMCGCAICNTSKYFQKSLNAWRRKKLIRGLRKFTSCNSIALPGVEGYYSKPAPIIMFNTYTTQFTCSHYGILIRKKITTYLDAKGTYKKQVFLDVPFATK